MLLAIAVLMYSGSHLVARQTPRAPGPAFVGDAGFLELPSAPQGTLIPVAPNMEIAQQLVRSSVRRQADGFTAAMRESYLVDPGTRVLRLGGFEILQVYILEGAHNGEVGYVPRTWLHYEQGAQAP